MRYLVSINYEKYLFDSATTADTFAALAKNHIVNSGRTKDVVTVDYLTDQEAEEYEKRN